MTDYAKLSKKQILAICKRYGHKPEYTGTEKRCARCKAKLDMNEWDYMEIDLRQMMSEAILSGFKMWLYPESQNKKTIKRRIK